MVDVTSIQQNVMELKTCLGRYKDQDLNDKIYAFQRTVVFAVESVEIVHSLAIDRGVMHDMYLDCFNTGGLIAMLRNFDDLIHRVKGKEMKTMVLVAADDANALEAVIQARDMVRSILIGPQDRVAQLLRDLGENPDAYWIVDEQDNEHPCVTASRFIHQGQADFLMKGRIATGDMLRGVLKEESNLRQSELMTHMAIFQLPEYHKLLFLTDSGMCMYPNLDEKKQILRNGIQYLHQLGYACPNVAGLCAVEQVSDKMLETVHADALKSLVQEGRMPRCNFEGPISYDLTMVPKVAKVKGYDSPYVGNFDMLFVPDFVAGNILGKCLIYTGGAQMAGLILGAKVPIVLTSRGASAAEKYNSIAIAAGVESGVER